MTMHSAQPLSGRRIFFVEDSGTTAYQLHLGLTIAGAESVHFCGRLDQARKHLATCLEATCLPHVVIIDHHLGRQTGAHLAVWMEDQSWLHQVARVSYSGIDLATVLGAVRPTTYHATWQKPLDLPTLIARVAQVCQSLEQG